MKIDGIWSKLRLVGANGVSTRVGALGLAQFCGISDGGKTSFFSLSMAEPDKLDDISTVKCVKTQLKDGTWFLGLELVDEEFFKEFLYLCEDLVASVVQIEDETKALATQKDTYENWQYFFKKASQLSEEEARGLIGELLFISENLSDDERGLEVVEAWRGPFGASQDFVFEDFRAVEVKTLLPTATDVSISGVNQLRFAGELHLRITRLQAVSNNFLSSKFTIKQIVAGIESRLHGKALVEFRGRLNRTGHSIDSPLCADQFFQIGETKTYDANLEGFPKIQVEAVPLGIVKLKYKIQAHALNDFEV